ncbi:hypothetical protein KVT40_006597 [Elsinoe batatas]|uniref:Uncharacterized protein n=1 Tax=Elsinoe batatas TaxID=2601811 RepID=A0A8K0L1Z8_9PEZI|nr:hypothetical protein KVT40_006597 [Elsinoe batatas]
MGSKKTKHAEQPEPLSKKAKKKLKQEQEAQAAQAAQAALPAVKPQGVISKGNEKPQQASSGTTKKSKQKKAKEAATTQPAAPQHSATATSIHQPAQKYDQPFSFAKLPSASTCVPGFTSDVKVSNAALPQASTPAIKATKRKFSSSSASDSDSDHSGRLVAKAPRMDKSASASQSPSVSSVVSTSSEEDGPIDMFTKAEKGLADVAALTGLNFRDLNTSVTTSDTKDIPAMSTVNKHQNGEKSLIHAGGGQVALVARDSDGDDANNQQTMQGHGSDKVALADALFDVNKNLFGLSKGFVDLNQNLVKLTKVLGELRRG